MAGGLAQIYGATMPIVRKAKTSAYPSLTKIWLETVSALKREGAEVR